jgi:hypothetical protein
MRAAINSPGFRRRQGTCQAPSGAFLFRSETTQRSGHFHQKKIKLNNSAGRISQYWNRPVSIFLVPQRDMDAFYMLAQ